MQRFIVVAALLALSGCASYDLTLMSSDGTMGTGRATGMGTGTLEVALNGKLYKGTWVTAQGGSVGYGAVGATAFTVTSVDAGTTGNAMLRADDGSTLQCRFVYGEWSAAGVGQCRDSAGKVYELQISCSARNANLCGIGIWGGRNMSFERNAAIRKSPLCVKRPLSASLVWLAAGLVSRVGRLRLPSDDGP